MVPSAVVKHPDSRQVKAKGRVMAMVLKTNM
jgi:hypothetical protein